MQKTSQAALEFLTTYGWDILTVFILTVLIAVGALNYFGFLSFDMFSPNICILPAGIKCLDFEMSTSSVTVALENNFGEIITIDKITVDRKDGISCSDSTPIVLKNGEKTTVTISNCNNGDAGKRFNGDINIDYVKENVLSHVLKGSIKAKLTEGGPVTTTTTTLTTTTTTTTATTTTTTTTSTTVPATQVWSNCYNPSTEALYTGNAWDYTMGYKFSPNRNGQISKLCGYFLGTKTVTLYSSSYVYITSASVTSSNSWSCTSISPVSVTSGSIYYVTVYLANSGGAYQPSLSPYLPRSCASGSVNVIATVYQPGNGLGASHSEYPYYMYGEADVVFG